MEGRLQLHSLKLTVMRHIHDLYVPEMMEDEEKGIEEWEPVGRGGSGIDQEIES